MSSQRKNTRPVRVVAVLLCAAALAGSLAPSVSAAATRKDRPVAGTSPGSKDPSLESQPEFQGVFEQNVMIEMRDGIQIAANVTRPDVPVDGKAKHRFPVLVVASPYRKDIASGSYGADNYFTVRGYVIVNYDVRGTGLSEGTYPFPYNEEEQRDLYDVIEWAARQRWSSGDVGMLGQSYLGVSQYLAAAQDPPHLKAIFPCMAFSDPYRDAAYHGGIFNGAFMAGWAAYVQALWTTPPTSNPDPEAPEGADTVSLAERWLMHSTSNKNILQLGLENPYDNELYRTMAIYNKYDEIRKSGVAIYHCGGWYDGFTRATAEHFRALGDLPNQRMILGPWWHSGRPRGDDAGMAGYTFGYADTFDINHEMLRWFDHYLKGMPDSFKGWPRVEYFSLGADEWRFADAWRPPEARTETLYLSGEASGLPTELSLTGEKPSGDQPADVYLTHPNGTGETTGRKLLFAYERQDQRADDAHALSYLTTPLEKPLDLAGPMELNLYASSSATDTDWIAKVTDVAPDGSSTLVATGYLRASHRSIDPDMSEPLRPWHRHTESSVKEITPDEVERYRIEIWPIGYRLARGHRLRLNISSWDVPTHTPLATPALNSVFHDGDHLSALKISVLP